ncbi:MAG: hypothetical protein ACTHNT_13610 [Actinomycetales bacterium]
MNAAAQPSGRPVPAWKRVTEGETRLAVTVAIVVMIALQVALPERLTLTRTWALPAFEGAMLVVLVAANPARLTRRTRPIRLLSLALIAVASIGNGWSAAQLIDELLSGGQQWGTPTGLLANGAVIWLTNVLVFALWYWELDRGGPSDRAQGRGADRPDFLFAQMSADVGHHDWEPGFVDYLYVAFTNATAFSPTDTLPLSRWAKLTMMLQSAISLVTVALVIARAVNILR